MVRCRCAVFALAMGVAGAACDSTRPLPPAVFVEPRTLQLEDGQTAKLSAKLRNPKSRTVRWSSSNPAVATVDLNGNVTALTNGMTDVVVRMTDDTTISTTVPVKVIGPAVATIAVTPASATVYLGLARQIRALLKAADGRVLTGRAVAWSSADATIADVSSAGIVRGRAIGGPIALAATSEGRTATAQVHVAYDADVCPFIAALAVGIRADGRLTLGDCEFRGDDSFVDVYEFTLTTAATVQIDLTSADFDAYLGLFDGAGIFLTQDDDSGGGQNAQIVRQLTAGKYRIWANTIAPGTGAYSLLVTTR